MGSHFNFKLTGDTSQQSTSSGRPPVNLSLARQPSIYSLTFEEFQNAMGGYGKDYGSMNMDEFLKNVWSAEENQVLGSAFGVAEGGIPGGGNLQRQGSLTLPRTLSQKTVDEVWKDLFKENGGDAKDGNINGGLDFPQQRQQTLGEMTLEEFLVRAGVVREEAQVLSQPQLDNTGFYRDLVSNNNNPGLSLGFGQLTQDDGAIASLIGGNNSNNNNITINQSPDIGVNGVKFQQQQKQLQQQQQQQKQHQQQQQQQKQLQQQQHHKQPQEQQLQQKQLQQHQKQQQQQQQKQQQQHHQKQQQQQQQQPQQQQKQQHQPPQLQQQQQQNLEHHQHQPLFPKQPVVPYASQLHLTNGQLVSPGTRSTIMGITSPRMNNGLVHGGGLQGGAVGMSGFGAAAVTVATGSPANLSSDGVGKSNGDLSSLSPVNYSFSAGLRGRRSGTVEKVVERRQRRMIKNRESAARSRARKQAYTMELEAELAKLREQNEDLQKKQTEIMEMQKIKVLEMMNQQSGPKKQCLRRTQTGPW